MLNGNRTKSNRKRSPRDLYITPEELAGKAMLRFYLDECLGKKSYLCLDAGCGTGIWGRAMNNLQLGSLEGIDIEVNVIDNLPFYKRLYTEDFLDFEGSYKYDIVLGNPPYILAEEFIRHSLDLIKKDGYVYFLLRLSFLEGIDRGKNLFTNYPPKRIYVSSRRPSFFSTNGRHTTDTLAYAMFLWQKDYHEKTELTFLDWEYDNEK